MLNDDMWRQSTDNIRNSRAEMARLLCLKAGRILQLTVNIEVNQSETPVSAHQGSRSRHQGRGCTMTEGGHH